MFLPALLYWKVQVRNYCIIRTIIILLMLGNVFKISIMMKVERQSKWHTYLKIFHTFSSSKSTVFLFLMVNLVNGLKLRRFVRYQQ